MPEYRLIAFRRRDAGGSRVDNGRPFGVELAVEDWADEGGACEVRFTIEPPEYTLTPTAHSVLVPADKPGKARLQLTVLGEAGSLARITAQTPAGDQRTLTVLLRGRGA